MARDFDAVAADLDAARRTMERLDAEHRGAALPADAQAEYDLAREQYVDLELELRDAQLAEIARRDPMLNEPPERRTSRRRPAAMAADAPGRPARDAALRAIERSAGVLDGRAGDRLVDLIESDRFGLDSRYVEAVSNPAYETAFAKKLSGVDGAEGIFTSAEAEAMRAVGGAMAQRAMAIGEGPTGGFGVPLSLDPTILLTNDGGINPIREQATVSTVVTGTWQGVSSAGVEAVFAGEATEAEDGSPELGQPEISPSRASIWVPYSFEVGQDWPGLAAELGKLFADAKSVKEAEVFAVGKGKEDVPEGLITGATKLVETKTKETVAVDDVYALQEALAARWQPRASWLSSLAVANVVARFVGGGSEEPALFNADRTKLLGKPWAEVSTMSTKPETKKEKICVYGDISAAFRIIDRIGLSIEPVPVVLKEGKPTGQRGLFAFFRVGSKVVIPEAVQVLAVKE